MLTSLGEFVVRRRWLVLMATVVFLVAAGGLGGAVFDRLTAGGFDDPGSESSLARKALEERFGTGDINLVLLITATNGTVDDPQVEAEGERVTAELAATEGVAQAVSYWGLGGPPPLRSNDGRQALVLARIAGDDDEIDRRAEEISETFNGERGAVRVQVGGFAEIFNQIGAQVEHDLIRAERIAGPVTLALLVLVFGSVVAASLPLAVGVLAVIGTFLVLFLITLVTDVSLFSINLTTALGLGLAIDYSLFVVSRFREELRRGVDTPGAVVRTVQTAGRTVLFSALTVAISLGALLVFPLVFLRSFAYAGISVVVVAAVASIVVLPAVLAVLGPRIENLALFRRRPVQVGEGFWHSVATVVMRRPVPVAAAVVALLLLLGAPFLGAKFGLPDDRVLPPGHPGREVQDQIRANFSSREMGALSVVAEGVDGRARKGDIDRYAAALSLLRGVARVDAVSGSYMQGRQVVPPSPLSTRFASPAGTWLAVVPSIEPQSAEGEQLVRDLRAAPAPFDVKVSGTSAQLVDTKDALVRRIPIATGLVALATFVVLFLSFGSILVPVKAIVLNLLSLTATYGAMVWVFQAGRFSGFLDYTSTGTVDTTTPILMFCIAFGLSMDYEVFLLSRIKEEYDRSGDPVGSVAVGLERTGRIVTAAAALLAVVFLAFATSGVTFIKLFGLGLTLAVLMDATLIRATLVPAFMRLAGRANWWAPAPLRRLHERFGFAEAGAAPGAAEPDRPAPRPVAAG